MNIFVGNLPYAISEQDLRREFEAFGQVDSVRVIKDRETGKSKGFGFVEMPDQSAAQRAVTSLNGKEIGGRKAVVNESRPREDRPPRREGGGGGFGGRRNFDH